VGSKYRRISRTRVFGVTLLIFRNVTCPDTYMSSFEAITRCGVAANGELAALNPNANLGCVLALAVTGLLSPAVELVAGSIDLDYGQIKPQSH